MENLLNVFMH